MPKMDAAIYAAHMDSVLKLARREGGVSCPQLVTELNVTAPVARTLIKKAELIEVDQKGKTKFYTAPDGPTDPKPAKQSKPAVKAVTKPETDDPGEEEPDYAAELRATDALILATRRQIKEAGTKAGESLAEWATNSALVDALRAQLVELATKRLRLSS